MNKCMFKQVHVETMVRRRRCNVIGDSYMYFNENEHKKFKILTGLLSQKVSRADNSTMPTSLHGNNIVLV